MNRTSIISLFFLLAAAGAGRTAFAHERHYHEAPRGPAAPAPAPEPAPDEGGLAAVRNAYRERVEPVFRAKCFDCHSDRTRYPWYYRLPVVRRLIDDDIGEARKHIDMSAGFPFQGHGSPAEDIEAIGKTLREGTMPPFRYVLFNWDARLTEEERKTVLEWIEESSRRLPP